ncbi:hypothetical protein R1flu_027548 [Riccia fluitans]|uniref:LysM domain-containing protein n=1 Tax=Riccia fluitans TaxID=41844 RepID=A0ABD1XJ42_9MARC
MGQFLEQKYPLLGGKNEKVERVGSVSNLNYWGRNCMGHGRDTTSCTLRYKISLVDCRIGEQVASGGSMAGGHARSSSCDSSASSSSAGYIEHTVSRYDTLAGIAIKYGVEVADIKRMNGLVTDLQMFALKTLKIPLPGRHPPSSPNGYGYSNKQSSPRPGNQRISPGIAQRAKDVSNNRSQEKRPISSAMGLLRGYYGLSTPATRHSEEGMEMTVYKSDSDYQSEDEPFSPLNRFPEASEIRHLWDDDRLQDAECAVRNDEFGNGARYENGRPAGNSSSYYGSIPKPIRSTPLRPEVNAGDSVGASDLERGCERPVRRRGKAEGVSSTFTVPTLPVSITPDVERSSRTPIPLGKSSVLRPKIIPRVDFEEEMSPPGPVVSPSNGNDTSSGGSIASRALSSTLLSSMTVEGLISKIKRSASVPSLQEDKKTLKGDSSALFTFSSAAGTQGGVISSVLEGFQVPVVRRSKAALD